MNLKIIKESSIFNPIYNLILDISNENELNFEKSLVVFDFKEENKANIQICFWLEDNRISCFVEEFEFIDEYIEEINQSINIRDFLKVFLSSKIEVLEFKDKKEKLYKKQISYNGLENGNIKTFVDTKSLKFIFPWNSIKSKKTVYVPVIGNGTD